MNCVVCHGGERTIQPEGLQSDAMAVNSTTDEKRPPTKAPGQGSEDAHKTEAAPIDAKRCEDPADSGSENGQSTSEGSATSQNPKKVEMSKKKSHFLQHLNANWIVCSACGDNYHLGCSGLEQYEYHLLKTFHCSTCSPLHGASIEHSMIAPHRRVWFEPTNARTVEIGSKAWTDDFILRESGYPAPSDEWVVVVDDGTNLKSSFDANLNDGVWNKIFIVKNSDALRIMRKKEDTFDLDKLVTILGAEYKTDVIEVNSQKTYEMSLGAFQRKMQVPEEERTQTYNFLSLEFSGHEILSEYFKAPELVRELSMIHVLYPEVGTTEYERLEAANELLDLSGKPKVDNYILAGMSRSYTDFHIDFGGSGVFYHVIKGRKVFYLVKPTTANLQKFKIWSKTARKVWFGDKLPHGEVKRMVVEEGNTLLMPSGWIHAVYTPEDSLIYGGNVLCFENYQMQFAIYRMENDIRQATGDDAKFFFPEFEHVHWMFLRNKLLPSLRAATDEGRSLNRTSFLKAVKFFASEMKGWLDENAHLRGNNYNHGDLPTRKRMIAEVDRLIKRQEAMSKKRARDDPAYSEVGAAKRTKRQ